MSKIVGKYKIDLFLKTKVILTKEEIEKFINGTKVEGVKVASIKRRSGKLNPYSGEKSIKKDQETISGYMIKSYSSVTEEELREWFNDSEYEDEDDNPVTYDQVKDDEDWEDIIATCTWDYALEKAYKVEINLKEYINNIQRAKFTEEDRQAYLMRLVRRAEDELKKKALPKKHKRFVDTSKIEFEWFDYEALGEYLTLGQYYADKYGKNAKIYVGSKYLDFHILTSNVHFLNRDLIETIQHEMIHHYVNTRFNIFFDFGFHRDSSPIFLAYLQWFGILESGHKSSKAFKRSRLYNEVNECKTFDELEDLLINYVIKYRIKFSELKEFHTKGLAFNNTFVFGSGDVVGLTKHKVSYVENVNKIEEKIVLFDNTFKVGSCVMPEDIDRLYNRKKYSLKADSVYNLGLKVFREIMKDPEASKKYKLDEKEFKILNFKGNRYYDKKYSWYK